MSNLERQIKSISHAMIAHGYQIYTPLTAKNYFLANRLVCVECREPWFMNFPECFLCGGLYLPLYHCDNCGSFSSITGSTGKCSTCGKQGTLHIECPNPDCLTNTDLTLNKSINKLGGVFDKNSGFRISQQHCLKCGSQNQIYQVRKIHFLIINNYEINTSNYNIDDPELLKDNTFLILRIESTKISYAAFSQEEFERNSKLKINQIYSDLNEVLDKIFSKI